MTTGISTNNENKKELDKLSQEYYDSERDITVYYVNDPLCSYCWQEEPYIRKFFELYKDRVSFVSLLGGLMPSLEEFQKQSPEMTLDKFQEMFIENGKKYGMPIAGTVWTRDPITSSIPASLAYKQVQYLSQSSSLRFLRVIREELFAFDRNISRDDVIEDALDRIDRNGKKIVSDSKSAETREALDEDFIKALKLKVTSFPTLVIKSKENGSETIVGLRDFEDYKEALDRVAGHEVKQNPLPSVKDLFKVSRNVFEKELMVMYNLEKDEVIPFLEEKLGKDNFEVRKCQDSYFVILKPGMLN